mmetsp:Transcript_7188/g.18399  ORF Transcript_7188/g.18399 Transcript_7188/m.18399 type:complete len:515 (-) Transcript_7188:545-2089(-)
MLGPHPQPPPTGPNVPDAPRAPSGGAARGSSCGTATGAGRFSQRDGASRPRRPPRPEPHEKTVPSSHSASECTPPAATATARAPSLSGASLAGTSRVASSPSPSWPDQPKPHEARLPSERATSEWAPPAPTETGEAPRAISSSPRTRVGTARCCWSPSPRRPFQPFPKASTQRAGVPACGGDGGGGVVLGGACVASTANGAWGDSATAMAASGAALPAASALNSASRAPSASAEPWPAPACVCSRGSGRGSMLSGAVSAAAAIAAVGDESGSGMEAMGRAAECATALALDRAHASLSSGAPVASTSEWASPATALRARTRAPPKLGTRAGRRRSFVSPRPRAPHPPKPVAQSEPLAPTKSECNPPAATPTICSAAMPPSAPTAAISVGCARTSSSPWPSLPHAPSPHDQTRPEAETARACEWPAEMATTRTPASAASALGTSNGLAAAAAAAAAAPPSPSVAMGGPAGPAPKACTMPSASSARLNASPAATAMHGATLFGRDATASGPGLALER